MKTICLAAIGFILGFPNYAKNSYPNANLLSKQSSTLAFVVNVGQVKDQNMLVRNDIQYKVAAANGLNVYSGC